MNARRFVLFSLSFFIVGYALLYLLYFLVNPEQRYERSLTPQKFFYTRAYSHRQFEALKTGRYTLIFGTSQIHRISGEMLGAPVLNFHNLYGEPGDILNFLRQLSPEQVGHIDRIICAVDLEAKPGRKEDAPIDYNDTAPDFPPLTLTMLSRTAEDIARNLLPATGYLNADGSITNLDRNRKTAISPHPYPLVYPFDDALIRGYLAINDFATAHRIEIIFVTPVVADAFNKRIDFQALEPFFASLLEGGVKKLKLYYIVPGMSDLKDETGAYVAFMDPTHLNVHFVDRWLHEHVLKDDAYTVSTPEELDAAIMRMQRLQQKP